MKTKKARKVKVYNHKILLMVFVNLKVSVVSLVKVNYHLQEVLVNSMCKLAGKLKLLSRIVSREPVREDKI